MINGKIINLEKNTTIEERNNTNFNYISGNKIQEIDFSREFNFLKWFSERKTGFSLIIAGKRGSGKTILIKWLMREFFKNYFGNENIILVKDSKYDNENYSDFISNDNIIDFYPKMLESFVNYQQMLYEKKKSNKILLIFDDCMNRQKLKLSKSILDQLFFNGRHMNISIIFSSQYMSIIDSAWIENTDLVIIKNVLGENFCENIRRNFASEIPKTRFIRFLKKIFTESKYNYIIFDGTENRTIFVEKIKLLTIKKRQEEKKKEQNKLLKSVISIFKKEDKLKK